MLSKFTQASGPAGPGKAWDGCDRVGGVGHKRKLPDPVVSLDADEANILYKQVTGLTSDVFASLSAKHHDRVVDNQVFEVVQQLSCHWTCQPTAALRLFPWLMRCIPHQLLLGDGRSELKNIAGHALIWAVDNVLGARHADVGLVDSLMELVSALLAVTPSVKIAVWVAAFDWRLYWKEGVAFDCSSACKCTGCRPLGLACPDAVVHKLRDRLLDMLGTGSCNICDVWTGTGWLNIPWLGYRQQVEQWVKLRGETAWQDVVHSWNTSYGTKGPRARSHERHHESCHRTIIAVLKSSGVRCELSDGNWRDLAHLLMVRGVMEQLECTISATEASKCLIEVLRWYHWPWYGWRINEACRRLIRAGAAVPQWDRRLHDRKGWHAYAEPQLLAEQSWVTRQAFVLAANSADWREGTLKEGMVPLEKRSVRARAQREQRKYERTDQDVLRDAVHLCTTQAAIRGMPKEHPWCSVGRQVLDMLGPKQRNPKQDTTGTT